MRSFEDVYYEQKLEEFLEEIKYNHIHDILGRFGSLSGSYSQEVKQLETTMKQKYPEVQEVVKYFGSGIAKNKIPEQHKSQFVKIKNKTYTGLALNNLTENNKPNMSIFLNKRYTKDPKTFDKTVQAMYDQKWVAANGLEESIAHEFGHAVSFHLLTSGQGKSFLDFIGSMDHEGEVSRMTNMWLNIHNKNGRTVSNYANYAESQYEAAGNEKYRLAMLEQFSEGFAALHAPEGNKEHPYMKSMKKLLEMTYGEGGPMNKKTPKKNVPMKHTSLDPNDKEGYANIQPALNLVDKMSKSAWFPDEIDIVAHLPKFWIEEPNIMPEK